MTGLIEEIQRSALDQKVSLVVLLRQAKVAASKLRLPSLEAWIAHELSGYPTVHDLPDYRVLQGRPAAFNPYNGWIPIIMPTAELNDMLSTVQVCQSVASLEQIDLNDGNIHWPMTADMIRMLNEIMEVSFGRMVVRLGGGQIAHILESTRGRVLDWALKLEEAGVTGQGLSFTDKEREIAQTNPTIAIHNSGTMVGAFGTGNTATGISVVGADASALAAAIEQISANTGSLVSAGVDERALRESLGRIEAELGRASPNRTVLGGLVGDLRTLLSGAGGNLVAAGAIKLLEAFSG